MLYCVYVILWMNTETGKNINIGLTDIDCVKVQEKLYNSEDDTKAKSYYSSL